ncbi:MAG: BatA domain-containing protein [Planctomycetia bacterium]|nr:BatA domain-containing protein [Planctomycetia bacterium]
MAFGWGSPALLWWLALAATPVIIHLLSKRRHREMEWAAMRFLLEAMRKNSRRLRIEQLVLMAVRALILALVVVALAQLLLNDPGGLLRPRQPAHKIIVIDASTSMGLVSRDESLFERARQAARAIAGQGRPGDVFNLVRLSNVPPSVIVPDLAYEPAKVVDEIEQMSLPHGTADVPGCLEKVADLLKLAPDVPQKEVYLISDFQRTSWSAGPEGDAVRTRSLLKQIDAAGKIVLVDVGQFETANVAVTSLESLEAFVTPARPAPLRATIRNFGTERVTGRHIELLVDDKLVEQRAVDLAAGAEAVENYLVPFSYGGERRVQVRLQKDSLPLDDQRWLVVPVKDKIRVLCVNGGHARTARGKATDYLELALAPEAVRARRAPGGADRSRIEPTVISEGELQGFDLGGYDCVFFCNVRRFTDREAQVIETYLQGGGGVVWSLGDQVSAESYDEILFRQGTGSLPARLGDRQGEIEQRETAFEFDPGDFSHPIVAAFQGNPDAGLERAQTYAYIRATLPAGNASRVALAFDSGDPAVVERSFGRGRSILVTTSVDE